MKVHRRKRRRRRSESVGRYVDLRKQKWLTMNGNQEKRNKASWGEGQAISYTPVAVIPGNAKHA
jgi:hypothetical protein